MSQKLRLHFDTPNQVPVHVCICSSADAGRIWWVRVAQSRALTTCQVFGLENVVMRFYWHRFTADELINYVNLLLNYYYTNGSVTVISDYNFTWNLRHARLPVRNPRADHTHMDMPSCQAYSNGILCAALAWPRIRQHKDAFFFILHFIIIVVTLHTTSAFSTWIRTSSSVFFVYLIP